MQIMMLMIGLDELREWIFHRSVVHVVRCVSMRFDRTALYANENGFPIFTTTNATSRWKVMSVAYMFWCCISLDWGSELIVTTDTNILMPPVFCRSLFRLSPSLSVFGQDLKQVNDSGVRKVDE